MGQLVHFPVPVRASQGRASRVFKPQREMQQAMRHAHLMMAWAILTTALMMLGLHLFFSL